MAAKPLPQTIGADTPAAIAAVLRSMPTFQPSLSRKEYDDQKDIWQLYLDLLELDYGKLQKMVLKHGENEDCGKYKIRQLLSLVVNLVPTVLNIVKLYLFSEEPQFDAKGDKDLEAFLKDCDGNGKSFAQFVHDRALPMALLNGYVDLLVQNPLVTSEVAPRSAADIAGSDARPQAFLVPPLQRLNWSCRPNGRYNWVCFQDVGNEDDHPLRRNALTPTAYITLSAANAYAGDGQAGWWVRSWMPLQHAGSGSPPAPVSPPPAGSISGAGWTHEGGWCPTQRVPVATLYYQESNDPARRHTGVSKVATIAVLTKYIVQILSWTTEDVLANLALLAIPSPGGRPPTNEDGSAVVTALGVFSTIFYDSEAKNPPSVVQGETSHVEVKLKLVELCVREILRLAHLVGASGEAEQVTSGVQGMVMRTELHRELADIATSLDRFALDTFALVKSWATGEDWTTERLLEEVEPVATFFKGPYTMEPISDVIRNAEAMMALFREISPTLVKSGLKLTARTYLPADDQDLATVIQEIDDNTDGVIEGVNALEHMATAAAVEAGRQTGTLTVTEEQSAGGNGPAGDAPPNGSKT